MREAIFGDCLRLTKDEVPLKDDETYRTVGILSYGKGLFERPTLTGAETRYQNYFRIRKEQFVYSKLFAWEGALAVVPVKFDGWFVSSEFPTFDIDKSVALPAYLRLLCQWKPLWQRLREGETGLGGRRKRVHPTHLTSVKVPLPEIQAQRRIVDLLQAIDEARDSARRHARAGQSLLAAARNDLVDESGDPRVPLADVASIESTLVDPRLLETKALGHVGVERIESGTGRLLPLATAEQDGVTSGKYLFTDEDVVYAKIRPNLRKAVWPRFGALCSADAYPLRVKDGYQPGFLLEVLLSDAFTSAAVAKSGRTKMPKVNRKELFEIRVPNPSEARQEEVVKLLGALREVSHAATRVEEQLSTLRESLLMELLTGTHEIPETYDRILERVA